MTPRADSGHRQCAACLAIARLLTKWQFAAVVLLPRDQVVRKSASILRGLYTLAIIFSVGSVALPDDFAKNEEVRRVLRSQGDDGSSARQVQHYAYFPTLEAEIRYRDLVLARGYRLDRETNDGSHPKPWSIVFSKLQAPNDIDNETEILNVDAANLGGEYDGWETDIRRSL